MAQIFQNLKKKKSKSPYFNKNSKKKPKI